MGSEVNLILTINNTDYVKRIKEAQAATQKLYDETSKGTKKVSGIIQQEEANIKKLNEWKRKASADNISMFNKEIEASEKRLELYSKTGDEIEKTNEKTAKSGGGLLSALKSWGLGFASVTTIVAGFKAIIGSTDTLSDKFAATLNGWKEGFASMARAIANNDFKDFFKNVKAAVAEGQRFTKELDRIEDTEIAMGIKIAKEETNIQELRYTQVTDKDLNKRKAAGIEAERLTKEAAQMRVDLANMVYANDIKHAASIAGYRDKELEKGKELVNLYLLQDEAILKQIETGKEYNALQKRLQDLSTPQGGTAPPSVTQIRAIIDESKAIEAKLKSMGAEGVEYGKLANGMGNLTGELRLKLKTDEEAIQSAKQSAFNLRLGSKNAALETKDLKKENDKQSKDKEELAQKLLKLQDDYDKSQIESLTGINKLKAQRDFGVKQIALMRDELAKLGPITEEQYNMLQQLADNVWRVFYDEVKKQAKIQAPEAVIIDVELKAKNDSLTELKKQLAQAESELFKTEKGSTGEGVLAAKIKEFKVQIEEIEAGIDTLTKKKVEINVKYKADISEALLGEPEFHKLVKLTEKRKQEILGTKATKPKESIWELFGIDPATEEGKQVMDVAQKAYQTTIQMMDDIYQKRVEDAQRTRELLDTRVQETQEALNQEIALQKAGYASNVEGKKKELNDLKVQRDISIAKENEALKKQRQLDALQQASSLLTATANIIKGYSKLPLIGQVLSIVAIAAMFAAFAAARVQANSLSKLEKGGYGEVKGKRHSQGGERFTDHIEVEDSEKWGVLSRPASKKYGKSFYQIVEGFNKDNPVILNKALSILNSDLGGRTIEKYNSMSKTKEKLTFVKLSPDVVKQAVINDIQNNIKIENTGANKKLDEVNSNLKQLHKKPVKEEIFETGKETIIIKGQSRRIIRNGTNR